MSPPVIATRPWTAAHLAALSNAPGDAAPVIERHQVHRVSRDLDVWDLGPVRTPDGGLAVIGGREWWIAISAPAVDHPGSRHDVARLRLLARTGGAWSDHGPLFPDGASMGSREWAAHGTIVDGRLDVLYTAVGGVGRPPFDQRIALTSARVREDSDGIHLSEWAPHREVLAADGRIYMPEREMEGAPGVIKAFRDPFPVRDEGGAQWLLFTASLADARSAFNGAIGIARHDGDGWVVCPPLVAADGVNNELERPHVVRHGGQWYVFFSTQQRTFAPGVVGPNGLYGFVADQLTGPYRPLNGTGLVVRNPPQEPYQAYSWFVLPDLTTISFVDNHSLAGRSPADIDAEGPEAARHHFGGTAAPPFRLWLDSDRAGLVDDGQDVGGPPPAEGLRCAPPGDVAER